MLKFNFRKKLIEQVQLMDLIQIGMKNYVFPSGIYFKLNSQVQHLHDEKVLTIDLNKFLVHLHIDKISIIEGYSEESLIKLSESGKNSVKTSFKTNLHNNMRN